MTRVVPSRAVRSWLVESFCSVIAFGVVLLVRSSSTRAADQMIRYPEHKNYAKYTFSIWAFPEEKIIPTLRAYYQFCKDYFRETGFRCDMLNVGYRIAEDRNPIFSYSYDGTVMTLDPVSTGPKGWDDFLRAYNTFCSEHDGVPLFNQSKWLTREQVRRAFGNRIAKFWDCRARLDPEDRLLNAYFRDLFQPS